MSTFLRVAGGVAVLALLGCGPRDGAGPPDPESISATGFDPTWVEERLTDHGVPGVSIAVIQDFDLLWARGYGVADVTTGAAVDEHTLFQAASISKPVAALASLKAVEAGRFGLDDDINTILTSWRLPDSEHTRTQPVTPRGLLSHTSGTGDGFGFPGYDPADPRPTLAQILDGEAPSNVGAVRVVRTPLTAFHYSGGGATLMQLALSDALGRPFADIADETVLGPLGMADSTFEQPLPPARDRNAARAHDHWGWARGPKWRVYPELAAAGLWTTATDLARFAIAVQRALRGDGDGAISSATARLMVQPVGVGDYGLGFTIRKRGEGWYFAHGGSNWGFRARLTAHTLKGYGVAFLTNADRGSELMNELQRAVEAAYGWDSLDEPVPR